MNDFKCEIINDIVNEKNKTLMTLKILIEKELEIYSRYKNSGNAYIASKIHSCNLALIHLDEIMEDK